MKRLAVTAAVLAVAAPLAWAGGELHRRNCIDRHRVSCSVLPWDDGQPSGQDRLLQKYGLRP